MGYTYTDPENLNLFVPKMLGALSVFSMVVISALAINHYTKPEENTLQRSTLRRVEAYTTDLNNDNYLDLIIKRNGDYNAFLGLGDGNYKPFNLSEQQRGSIEGNLGE